jgi:hypothetical protein
VTFQGLCRDKGGLLTVWGCLSSSSWTRWIRRSFCFTSLSKWVPVWLIFQWECWLFSLVDVVLRSWFLGSWESGGGDGDGGEWLLGGVYVGGCRYAGSSRDGVIDLRVFRWCLWCYAIYPAYNFGIWFLWFGSCWSWLFFLRLGWGYM